MVDLGREESIKKKIMEGKREKIRIDRRREERIKKNRSWKGGENEEGLIVGGSREQRRIDN